MNTCDICGYKVVSNALFERHMKTHSIDAEPVSEAPVEEPCKSISDEVTLKFSKPVEVYINGKAYVGQEITVPNMSLAAEIVRITREAYGPNILV